MAPKSVTFRRHDHLVSVLFGDLLSHSYNITFSMFLDLVTVVFVVVFMSHNIIVIQRLMRAGLRKYCVSAICLPTLQFRTLNIIS